MKRALILFFIATVIILVSCSPQQQKIEKDVNTNTKLIQNIPFQEILGPLAPIAISPFFGLTLTSGASILAQNGLFEGNMFLQTNHLMANYWVFGILLLLTVCTSFPNMFKATKWIGLIVSYIEDYSTLICLLIIFTIPFISAQENNVVQQAGIVDISYSLLLMFAVSVNYIVIQSVRYFFEILIFISPFPFVDGILESTKKTTAGALYSVYLISPWLAFILNVILFIIMLFLFNTARRYINYYSAIYLKSKIFNYFGIERPIVDVDVAYRYKKQFSHINFCIPVFIKKSMKYKNKTKAWLMHADEQLYIIKPKFLRKPVLEMLDNKIYGNFNIGSDYFCKHIFNDNQKNKIVLVVSEIYKKYYDDIKNYAKFNDQGISGTKKLTENTKQKIKLKWKQLKEWFENEDLKATETV